MATNELIQRGDLSSNVMGTEGSTMEPGASQTVLKISEWSVKLRLFARVVFTSKDAPPEFFTVTIDALANHASVAYN